ncbi:hypothetical protein [Pelolinea submarina]|uniref:Histidine kinase N-terminal 7TM region domain-containing protein n=1 Tax=Pelolinea submarina TaxID=913107 RepID=A0A347ZSA7_9CHLR|nr:hypothetical protein [Pelolinea submarina]REG11246.1 hypothetical protein DFR64_1124 [Pelolinea submarina]BBB48188.1 hypothetical protein Pelsub_P1416 [Pelolinea submarina]
MSNLSGLETLLKAISDILTAGVAIISFSLFIYAVTFKLHDKVTLSFTFLMLCIVVIFGADSFITVTQDAGSLRFLLKIHWLGIVLLPTAYFRFSDGLLSMTGKPSRGRRSLIGNLCIVISLAFAALLFTNLLVGVVIMDRPPAPYLERTIFNDLFSAFFFITMFLSWYNYIRAYRRTVTSTSRRRMLYLIISAVGPALGSFPYLLYGSGFAAQMPLVFWLLSIISNATVFITLITMTYAVSFFGFPWTDRVIKSRLFRWVMRGPTTASITLGVTTIINRLGKLWQVDVSALIVLAMVAVIVIFEYSITLFANIWERFLFSKNDREELEQIRSLEDKLLTSNDVRQFTDLILATICDLLQVQGAHLFVINGNGNGMDVLAGKMSQNYSDRRGEFLSLAAGFEDRENVIVPGNDGCSILPLFFAPNDGSPELMGVILVEDFDNSRMDPEKQTSAGKLTSRLALALHDRKVQENLFVSLEMLTPQVSIIQDLLATSRFNQEKIYDESPITDTQEVDKWVKDALDHLWGGPKLSQNMLLRLRLVEEKTVMEKESPVNALREVLRSAIDQLKPEGERQYTNEWILYNLLDLKYLSGWKVKDIARKLSLSEADLYRKQRIAISAVSNLIINMEKSITEKNN